MGGVQDLVTGSLLGDYLPEWAISLGTNLGVYFIVSAIGYALIVYVRKNPPSPTDSGRE